MWRLMYLWFCDCVVIQSSICSELEREKAELMLSSVPASDVKSRQTVASLLQQLQKQQLVTVSTDAVFLSHTVMIGCVQTA